MEREKYLSLRKQLLEDAQNFINTSNLEEYNRVEEEIKNLDKKFDEEAEALANLNALKGCVNKVPNEILSTINNIDTNKGNIFLNKGENLSDRILLNDSNMHLNRQGALGDIIKGYVTGKWADDNIKNAISTTATGVLIPEILSSKIIDRARNLSLFTNAGVPIYPMEEGNMTISRVKTDPSFSFKEEGKEGKEANFELDSIKFKAKTCYGYAYVTMEAIKSSRNLDDIVQQVFAQAMANTIDSAFIYGQKNDEGSYDDFAPSGIMNDSEINSITATENSGYDDFIKAIGKVRKSNGIPTAYAINSETEELLNLLKTSDGQYLDKPKSISDLNELVSNQLAYDSSKGSDALVFDPKALLIGMQNNIHIKIIEDNECLKKGLVGFQIYAMIDCKTVQPKHICKIEGIK